jgi:hypothetical protein
LNQKVSKNLESCDDYEDNVLLEFYRLIGAILLCNCKEIKTPNYNQQSRNSQEIKTIN